MTVSLNQGVVVMPSQIRHAQSFNIHNLCLYTRHLLYSIKVLHSFHTLPKVYHVMASHLPPLPSSLGYKHTIRSTELNKLIFGLPRTGCTHSPLTSAINTLLAIRYSYIPYSIHSCQLLTNFSRTFTCILSALIPHACPVGMSSQE